ncbi:MAG TPA: glycosyltransferase family 4 protein [Longimicrobium sp.]|nr:glycosyltransferase family 4 protein [Longimicrobium sp.]
MSGGAFGAGEGRTRRRILYIDHSGARGGALLALCSVIRALDRERYEPVVACIHDVPEVLDAFRAAGAETVHAPGISAFPHTTGGWNPLLTPAGALRALRAAAAFRPSARATEALVRRLRPDVVHLNSLVLAPSAAGARAAGVPVLWQVRESVHPGHARVRRRLLARALVRWPDAAVFVSADDRQRLGGAALGTVIPDSVDHRRFDRALDGAAVRAELAVPADAPLVLFLGGVSAIKGAHVLLAALPQARRRVPGLHAVVAGAHGPRSRSPVAGIARVLLPLVGSGTERQRFERAYADGGMEGWVRLLPFRADPERLMAAADVVVFPSTVPHSALPVIEAGAMAKPVVASRLGGVEELVEDGETGLLVPPADPDALAAAIARVLSDPALAARLGEAAYARSLERYALAPNLQRLTEIYDRLSGR